MAPTTRAWVVACAACGINLVVGFSFAWGALARELTGQAPGSWTPQQAGWPFMAWVASLALATAFAGRLEDRSGPRWTATAGSLLVGGGLLLASRAPASMASADSFPTAMVLGFGVISGVGGGLALSSTLPAAARWQATKRQGLVVAVAVAGVGLSQAIASPLAGNLLATHAMPQVLQIIAAASFVLIAGLAQLLANPPSGYVPPGSYAEPTRTEPRPSGLQSPWRETLTSAGFYILWAMLAMVTLADTPVFSIGATGHVPGALVAPASEFVALALAAGCAAGALFAGRLSDLYGRRRAMFASFLLEAIGFVMLAVLHSTSTGFGAAFLSGGLLGSGLTLFAVLTYDVYGTKNAGANFGLLFTAWGVGGVAACALALYASRFSGPLVPALWVVSAALCAVAAALTPLARVPVTSPAAGKDAREVAVQTQ